MKKKKDWQKNEIDLYILIWKDTLSKENKLKSSMYTSHLHTVQIKDTHIYMKYLWKDIQEQRLHLGNGYRRKGSENFYFVLSLS